jgi:hypothetical protein
MTVHKGADVGTRLLHQLAESTEAVRDVGAAGKFSMWDCDDDE